MSTTTTNKMPGAVYAVAGAGELAYRQLLKLPAVTAGITAELRRSDLPARVEQFGADLRAELPARVAGLRAELPARVEQLRAELPARVEQFRADFPAAMTTFVSEAYQVYNDLVALGEAVVEGRRDSDDKIVVKATTGTPSRGPRTVKKTTKAATATKATKTAKTAKPTKAAPKATKATKATKPTKATGSTAPKRNRPASPK